MEDTGEDDALGQLTWNEEEAVWSGSLTLPSGHSVSLTLALETEDDEFTDAMLTAQRTVTLLLTQEQQWRRQAESDLCILYNTQWNQGEDLSQAAFVASLSLTAIIIDAEGRGELYYDAGNLFAGHMVLLPISAEGHVGDAHLAREATLERRAGN